MHLVGLMCVRNESWILGASLRAAMRWCDDVVLVDHASSDRTYRIYQDVKAENPWRIQYSRWDDTDTWDEMAMRQHSLALGRKWRGTHFALIDADEILVANWIPYIRQEIIRLELGEALETKMLAMRTLTDYQDDGSVWSNAWISLAFADDGKVTWKPQLDGYQHHHRLPHGILRSQRLVARDPAGQCGVMHYQFANKRRLLAKHVLYRMVDHMRWPDRETVEQLNWKYDQALKPPDKCSRVPMEWHRGLPLHTIDLDGDAWQEWTIRKLLWVHGRDAFKGLDLKGY